MIGPYTTAVPGKRVAAIWSRFSEDQLLDNIMLYVVPSAVVTATCQGKRLEQAVPAGARIEVPTGIAAFPGPVFGAPARSFAEKTYDVVHGTEMASGGTSQRSSSRRPCWPT